MILSGFVYVIILSILFFLISEQYSIVLYFVYPFIY
jgi:hypothetical protein